MPGAVCDLTEAQVAEVRAKIQHRYVRRYYHKGVLCGMTDVDVSDSGGITIDKDTGEHHRRAPVVLPGRSSPNDTPLKDIVSMEFAVVNAGVKGRVITRDQALAAVAAFEAEDGRALESVDQTFEVGKGGKSPEQRKKEEAALTSLSKSRPQGKGDAMVGGAGRLPDGAK